MKNILNISLLSLVVVFLSSCYDDKTNDSFARLYVSGPTGGAPLDKGTYSLGATEGSITWSIDNTDVASISSTSGTDAEVSYNKSGDFRITATVGDMSGWLDVTVSATSAGVSVEYDADGALRADSTGTMTFVFDAPLSAAPKFHLDSTTIKSMVDSIGTLTKEAEDEYSLFMRGGTGDGTAHGLLLDVAVTEVYGSDVADTLVVELFRVDNTRPLMTENDGPETQWVKIGDVVTESVTYNEAMRPAMTDDADTALWIVYEYIAKLSGGDEVMRDTIAAETEDGLTWTVTYTIPDSIAEGFGVVYNPFGGIVGDLLDLAGNEPVNGPSISSYNMDSTGPVVFTPNMAKTEDTRVNGSEEWINFQLNGVDGGVGIAEYYYHIRNLASDTTADGVLVTGPTTLDDFSGDAVYAKNTEFNMLMSVDSASYDIFVIAVDALGNVGEVDSTGFNFDNEGVFTYGHKTP